ncbi:hypothetical protein N0Y54_42700 [Nostoc punctiforme UO1]|uniref:hypothetical protein n=1 Tax=Nostoc punctiforme TaxID=272131 RepID=UPI0030B72C8C
MSFQPTEKPYFSHICKKNLHLSDAPVRHPHPPRRHIPRSDRIDPECDRFCAVV